MTGRARGRSRGRSRGAGAAEAQRPGGGGEEAPSSGGASVGRGRSRGPQPRAAEPAAPQAAKPPTDQMQQMTVSEEKRPRRPRGMVEDISTKPESYISKQGSTGDSVSLVANYFKLSKLPAFTQLYQYRVDFSPPVDSRGMRNFLLFKHSEVFGKVRVFDGMILYLPVRLPDDPLVLQTESEKTETTYTVTVTFTNEWPMGSPTFMQLLNIIMRRILKVLKMQQLGRNYFSEERHIDLKQHDLQLWPGYSTSIFNFDGGTMLCLDVSHKVLRLSTVLDAFYVLYNQSRQNFHDLAVKKFVGEIVMTRYNNKTYRIDDIHWDKRPDHEFELSSGEKITFVEYYKKQYDKVITDKDQPLLVSNPKKKDRRRGDTGPIYLLPELCVLTGLSDEIRSDFRVMKDLAVHTRIGPDGRARELMNFRDTIKKNEEATKFLQDWNVDFEPNLIKLSGRVFKAEDLHQEGKKYNGGIDADWSREMRGARLLAPVGLKNWIVFHTSRDSGIANDFVQTMGRVCGPMGIEMAKPRLFPLPDDKTETYLRALRSEANENTQIVALEDGEPCLPHLCVKILTEHLRQNSRLCSSVYYLRPIPVTCLVPNNRKDRYDAIKKHCCVDRPVPSQVIVGRTLSKKQMLMSVCTKIAIQLNCKLGGEVWASDIPIKSNMVIGIDVYHDSLTRGKSIGGFVASLNKSCTRYYSRVTQQQTGLEFIDGLRLCMTAALKKYAEVNESLPARIFVYRDGVGDEQLAMVYEHELPQLKTAISDLQPGYDPKFTMIVVKKRISTRILLDNRGNLGNPPPGTIVDSEITRASWYDFFLVSQSVKQGTVSPTHYNVIADTNGFKVDHIQRLTYKLCHLYYNWPGTIRVPAPCQYAHKLAFLVGQSIHQEPSYALADRLYYL